MLYLRSIETVFQTPVQSRRLTCVQRNRARDTRRPLLHIQKILLTGVADQFPNQWQQQRGQHQFECITQQERGQAPLQDRLVPAV